MQYLLINQKQYSEARDQLNYILTNIDPNDSSANKPSKVSIIHHPIVDFTLLHWYNSLGIVQFDPILRIKILSLLKGGSL